MFVTVNGNRLELNIEKDTFVPEDSPSLSMEACRAPGLIAQYGLVLADLKGQMEREKFTLDELSSFVADQARKDEGSGKLTEARLKEIVSLDTQVKQKREVFVVALRDMHAVDNSLRALHKKAEIITTLLYQHRQELKAYGNASFD